MGPYTKYRVYRHVSGPMHWDLNGNLNSPKSGNNSKKAQCWALQIPLWIRYRYQRSHILFKYMPIFGRYLRKISKLIKNMEDPNVGPTLQGLHCRPERAQKVQRTLKSGPI